MEKDTVNKKRDFGQKLQDFMASYRGKVIMNYAYSWVLLLSLQVHCSS